MDSESLRLLIQKGVLVSGDIYGFTAVHLSPTNRDNANVIHVLFEGRSKYAHGRAFMDNQVNTIDLLYRQLRMRIILHPRACSGRRHR
jgi:hypothetical protein